MNIRVYNALRKVAEGIPYDPKKHDLPRSWFTDRGYGEDAYNKYKGWGYSLNPVDRDTELMDELEFEGYKRRPVTKLQQNPKAEEKLKQSIRGVTGSSPTTTTTKGNRGNRGIETFDWTFR